MMLSAKQQFSTPFFTEIFMIGTWMILKQRNIFIFNRGLPNFHTWKAGFLDEASLQANRMKPDQQQSFSALLQLYR
jgi:hypothetical protein